ncbi:MAG: amidohydrolase family protein [Candidatus Kapaibacterium sp.]|nr:amidohydrolase family protein [Ignavibacteria bacterium]
MMPRRILHTAEVLYSPDGGDPRTDQGVLVDEDGKVLAIASTSQLQGEADERRDHQLLMPGVLNAHIHLTDAGRKSTVPGGEGLVAWVRNLMRARDGNRTEEEQDADILTTLKEMIGRGTVAVGEVVNHPRTVKLIVDSGIHCRLIHELIGFSEERAEEKITFAEKLYADVEWSEQLRHALGVHAPYSVSFALMEAIELWSRERGSYVYQHLAEDPAERDLYERGEGEWVQFLKEIGSWDETFQPPGISPIAYYDARGFLSDRFVAVHLADARAEEIRLLASRGVKVILSPTSNLHITGLLPPVRQMVEEGMTLALGTDGRGSNPSMDVFDEARFLYSHFPDLPAGTLLRALTLGGAEVLGFPQLGRVAVGTRPGLVSVESMGKTINPEHLEDSIFSAETAVTSIYSDSE